MTDNPHYVTPAEAQHKYCPVMNPSQACIGKQCMLWRWKYISSDIDPDTKEPFNTYSTTHGYCGMMRND